MDKPIDKPRPIPDYTCSCGNNTWVIWWDCIICDKCGNTYELDVLHPAIFNKEKDNYLIK